MLFSVTAHCLLGGTGGRGQGDGDRGGGTVLHMKVWSLVWAHLLMSTELELTKKCTQTLMEAAALS